MNDEKLKNQLGANIVMYRKRSGLTQAKLAEQLNYSDKAVSKWERDVCCPDISLLPEIYPSGDEIVTIYETTGRIVKPGKLPISEGVIVFNVETMLNAANAIREAKGVTFKYITSRSFSDPNAAKKNNLLHKITSLSWIRSSIFFHR